MTGRSIHRPTPAMDPVGTLRAVPPPPLADATRIRRMGEENDRLSDPPDRERQPDALPLKLLGGVHRTFDRGRRRTDATIGAHHASRTSLSCRSCVEREVNVAATDKGNDQGGTNQFFEHFCSPILAAVAALIV